MSVYFVTCREAGVVKIGFADNPLRRLCTLQTACPLELTLEGVMVGSRDDERAYHAKFAEQRVRGEWFKITPEIESLIYGNPPPDTANKRFFRQRLRRMERLANHGLIQVSRHLPKWERRLDELAVGKVRLS